MKFFRKSVNGPELNANVGKVHARLSWGQLGLWYDGWALILWLNPLVWCRHGAALHLRGHAIEVVQG